MYLEPRHKKEQISGVECVNALIFMKHFRDRNTAPTKVGLYVITGYEQDSYLSMMKGINGWQSILGNSNWVLAQVVTLPEEISIMIYSDTNNKDNTGYLNIVI